MRLDRSLVHPAVLAKEGRLDPAERVYLDTLEALRDSQRNAEEMREASDVLNPLLEARADLVARGESPTEIDAIAEAALKAACGARDARSGMGCDLALDLLRLALDDARAAIVRESRPQI